MFVDTNIHLDGVLKLSLKRGEHFVWIVLEDGDKGILKLFPQSHDVVTEAKLRRAVEAFNYEMSREDLIPRVYFGIYYTGNGSPELCEVDGGVCFEAFRTHIGAQARMSSNSFPSNHENYVVLPIPAGTRVWDRETDREVVCGDAAPVAEAAE